MATYAELYDIFAENSPTASALKNKITMAVAVAAEAIRTESGATTNHANRLLWAKTANSDPRGMAGRMLPAILAQNVGVTSGQILAATDAAILTAVNNCVDVFATGAGA